MPGAALAIAGVQGGLDIMAGLFGYFTGKETSKIYDSRARMIRMEAEADAERYSEQAQVFKSSQKLAFLKSGVELSGSPLDVLDETARVASENISAMRAGGEAQALDAEFGGAQARISGRNALLSGLSSAMGHGIQGIYQNSQTTGLGFANKKNVGAGT